MGSHKSFKAVIILLSCLSLFLTYCILLQQNSSTAIPITITISEKGFTPSEVFIHPGESVQFINIDTTQHWPASDPHPSHVFFSSFDPQKPLEPSEKWSILFLENGSFAFHDHVNHTIKGIIHVGEKKQMSDSFISKDERIVKLSLLKGKAVWEYVQNNFKESDTLAHEAAHIAGNILYKTGGETGIQYCNEMFSFGCYHGFIEGYSKEKDLKEETGEICTNIPVLSQRNACYHGFGHGFFTVYTDLLSSLSSCDNFPFQFHRSCYTGVFMEAMIDPSTGEKGQFSCTSLENKYQPSCYEYFPHLLKYHYHLSDKEIASICTNVSSPLKEECIRGQGQTISDTSLSDLKQGLSICTSSYIQKIAQQTCYQAVIEEQVFKLGNETSTISICSEYLSSSQCNQAIQTGQKARF